MGKAATQQGKAERRILKKFLLGYFKAKKRQEVLRLRLEKMRVEFAGENKALAGIEAEIKAQKQEAEKTALQIIEVLNFLPADSTERLILELRHVDCKTWAQIQRVVFLTPSPCFERYSKGLTALLQIGTVREIIGLKNRDGGMTPPM